VSEIRRIIQRDPNIFLVACTGCGREYRTSQPVTNIRKLTACQVCRPQHGNKRPSPFKGVPRNERGTRLQ
jgi:hypothetical protein